MNFDEIDEKAVAMGLRRARLANKKLENRGKPRLRSADVVQTVEFDFADYANEGDSGSLFLATAHADSTRQYIVKHACTDCACNEFIYAKLAQAMGYHVPETKLFRLTNAEKRDIFETEYLVGSRYLDVAVSVPSYPQIRERASNWTEWFSFYGMYALTAEGDGMETPLASDGLIYRIDTTDAFPISIYQLDLAGVNRRFDGMTPKEIIQQQLLSADLSGALPKSYCDYLLEKCSEVDGEVGARFFLEPFSRIQEIRDETIDEMLHTLCYFYPDAIGDFFKRYLTALQQQSADYWKEKRTSLPSR